MDPLPVDKAALRREMRARRLRLSPQAVNSMSAEALERVRGLDAYKRAERPLLYCPFANELDVAPLFAELWERGAELLLPRCRPGEPGAMDLVPTARPGDLCPGAHGILEPDPDACPALAQARPDLILAPGTAFDRRGHRLGFGGGYYDRLLASEAALGTVVIGMAYHFQLVESLPADPWDKPVHAVCTDKELLWTR